MKESNDEPCMCGTPFTCMADDHDSAVAIGIAKAEATACIAAAIGADEDLGLTGEALDAWNAATARAINIVRNWNVR